MKWFIKCLKQYVDFEGRARRKEYWWFMLINFIISMILVICWLALETAASGNTDFNQQEAILTMLKNPFLYIYLLYYIAVLIPGIAVLVRRLHDIGKRGWWILTGLIPLIGSIILLVWYCTEGQRCENEWGPDPKEGE